ncbi:hypothetical protein VE25_07485 [Devosia geojensis]|uniref:Helix-turn-helix domain-containing protein n=1 Tax=Devosia geojensis TaxID=443610 RepID=A0A0F5FUY5_9HYPH|nr:hypothetical protein [Devosia geojensis]KKB12385.1 hypothetical protein VE25_07485 [Devosia geojensis]
MESDRSVPERLDLIWGATAIAAALNRTRRQTFHMLENGELPAKKVGGRWVASRKKLEELFEGDAA